MIFSHFCEKVGLHQQQNARPCGFKLKLDNFQFFLQNYKFLCIAITIMTSKVHWQAKKKGFGGFYLSLRKKVHTFLIVLTYGYEKTKYCIVVPETLLNRCRFIFM